MDKNEIEVIETDGGPFKLSFDLSGKFQWRGKVSLYGGWPRDVPISKDGKSPDTIRVNTRQSKIAADWADRSSLGRNLSSGILPMLLIAAQLFSPPVDALPRRSPDVLALVDQARALRPEFRADTLLRLAGSWLVTQSSRKQELIEEAYWSGSHALLPYRQHADDRSDSVATNAVRANGLEA